MRPVAGVSSRTVPARDDAIAGGRDHRTASQPGGTRQEGPLAHDDVALRMQLNTSAFGSAHPTPAHPAAVAVCCSSSRWSRACSPRPAHPRVAGDELGDAQAQQRRRSRSRSPRRRRWSPRSNSPGQPAGVDRSRRRDELKGITADLAAMRTKSPSSATTSPRSRRRTSTLVSELADARPPARWIVEAQEAAKKDELGERKAAARRRASARPTRRSGRRCSRRSCSGASFTDMLAEMSYQLDVAEQDKALADADRRGPRDAARSTRPSSTTRAADEHDAPGDRGPEARARRSGCAS